MAESDVTAERLRELLEYDPATGIFIRKKTVSSRAIAGMVAGCLTLKTGYLVIRIDYRLYYAHRLAWLHETGSWPTHEIDHKDGDGVNNAWVNLRDVPHSINVQNRRAPAKKKKSGLPLGVFMDKTTGKVHCALSVNGRYKFIGGFDSPEMAYAAYVIAKRELHDGCTI